MFIATPGGWVFEESLSAKFNFVSNEEFSQRLKFLRSENGSDVFLDLESGKEVYSGRSKPS
jgi:hypothetical protein